MDSYIVLARKHRPQTFSDLVGQQYIASTLRNAMMQGRVAHAFLFTGSRGVGKTSAARIFAKALNCVQAPCEEPCNVCASCRDITDGRSMDVIEIDGASNRGINEIREVLEAVRYAPARDRYKIYIIDEVHMLTTEAFNALLKTLEEPPAHVVFIFATTDPNKIPVTIISRCQRYDFRRIEVEELAKHLESVAQKEDIAFEEAALRLIARTARGGVRDALSAMDKIIAFSAPPITGERAAEILGVASRETILKMVEAMLDHRVADALDCVAHVDGYGQNLAQFAYDLLEFLRDVTVLCVTPQGMGSRVELDAAEQAVVKSWCQRASLDRLQRLFHLMYQASEQISKSLSPRLLIEMTVIRMCQVENVVPLEGILRRLEALSRVLRQEGNLSDSTLAEARAFLQSTGSLSVGGGTEDDEKKKPSLSESASLGESVVSPALLQDVPVLAMPEPLTPVQAQEETEIFAPQTDDLPVAVDVLQNAGGTPALPVSTPRAEDEDKNTSAIHANTGSIPHAEDEEEDAHRVEDFSHLYSLEVITEDDNFSQSDTLHPLPTGDAPSPPSPAAPPPLEGEACGRSGGTSSPAKETGSPAKNKKKLEVSAVPPQNCAPEAAAENRCGASSWKVLVSRLEAPLSMIMSLAEVASFSEQGVGLALPNTLEGMISACRLAEFEREVARFFRKDVRCQIRYVEMSGEVETLAAEKMRTEIQAREDAIARLRATPVMGAVLEAFHIDDPDGIRFTFNSK